MPIRTLDANAPDAVFSFLDQVISSRGREHWRWKYRLGTAAPPSAFYWEEPDGRILGFIGMMRTNLHSRSQCHPAAWFVDWHVHAGAGVGLGLLRKAEAAAGILLTLQGSPDTRKILPRLGWKQSLTPTTWVRPLTARLLAEWAARRAAAPLRGVARVAARAAKPLLRCREPVASSGTALVDVDRFPVEYDEVWRARATEFAPAMSRDSSYINYLCADYPGAGYRLQLLRDGGSTVGHLISRLDVDRRGFRRGRIVDAVWPRSSAALAGWLIQSACWQLQRGGADYAQLVLSAPDLREVVRRNRFRCRGTVPIWYHCVPPEAPDPDSWYITFLDCDRAYR